MIKYTASLILVIVTAISAYGKNLNEDLYNALKNKDIQKINELIAEGANINSNFNGYSLFHIFLLYGFNNNEKDIKILKLLLKSGAIVNSRNNWSDTPLIQISRTIRNNNCKTKIELIKLLIKNGADVNARGYHGYTPLMILCESFNEHNYRCMPELVRLFIKKGAVINTKSKDFSYGSQRIEGQTALTYLLNRITARIASGAVSSGNLDRDEIFNTGLSIIRYLIKKGADVNADKNSPFYMAVRSGEPALIELLYKSGARFDKTIYKETPLHTVITLKLKPLRAVSLLLKLGEDVNGINYQGQTPLMLLLNKKYGTLDQDTAAFLIKEGADLNVKDKHGDTALIIAVRNHRPIKIISLLLKSGANVNSVNDDGKTALQIIREDLEHLRRLGIGNSPRENWDWNKVERVLLDNGAVMGKQSHYTISDFEKTYRSRNYRRLRQYMGRTITYKYIHEVKDPGGSKRTITPQQALQKMIHFRKTYELSSLSPGTVTSRTVVKRLPDYLIVIEIDFKFRTDKDGRIWLKEIYYDYRHESTGK